jgi:iron complex outermembrane receptor protein
VEGGFEADLWNNRLSLTYTQYDKARHNAIESIPVATSVYGGSFTSYYVNIGDVRSAGTEVTVIAQVLQSQFLGWNMTFNFSHQSEKLVRLRPGQNAVNAGDNGGTVSRLVEGYPLWGLWAYPFVSYVDANNDGVLESNEIHLGDSLVYLGQQQPKSTMGITTDLNLFHGTLGVHASVAYQGGFTQFNQAMIGSGALSQLGNTPDVSLATQAAIVAATTGGGDINGNVFGSTKRSAIGLAQTVSTLRFQSLTINYWVPQAVSRYFRVPHMQLALQGSNLGLHTNYRGLDPNVNAFSTASDGDRSVDTGQLPQPRTWSLQVRLSN